MNRTTTLLILAASLAVTSSAIAEVTVPNTFNAATPAVAAEVNANFTAVADGVNANTGLIGNIISTVNASGGAITTNANAISAITSEIGTNILNTGYNTNAIDSIIPRIDALEAAPAPTIPKTWRVYAAATEVGTLLNVDGNNLSYISDKGFAFPSVRRTNGALNNTSEIYYQIAGCVATDSRPGYSPQMPNVVFKNSTGKYYTSGGSSSVLAHSRRRVNGYCESYGSAVNGVYRVHVNDVAVTGGGQTAPHSFK